MSNEKQSFFIERLTAHAQKRALFLKHFDQLKSEAQAIVIDPDNAAMGLVLQAVEEDSFQLRFVGRNFKFAMIWPVPNDASSALISLTEIKKSALAETETKIMTVSYNRQGTTEMRGQDNDELQLKTPYDCSIILLYGLRTAVSA